MSETPLARVRRLCLGFPQAVEKESWGAPNFTAGPKGKMFAIYSDDHHGDGRVAVWLPAQPGKQEVLVSGEPKRFFKPPYCGPRGWIGVILALIDDEELMTHLREAFVKVATKKLAAELE